MSTSPPASRRSRLTHRANPFRLYRTGRLAKLLDVDPSTIWKWRQNGTLPEPIQIGGIKGWSEQQLEEIFAQHERGQR